MARSLEWARDIRLSRGVERPITPGHPVEGQLCPTLPLTFARVTDVLQTRLSFLRWTSTIASGAPPLAVCLVSETKVRQTTYMMWTRWSPVREDHLSRCHADSTHSTFLTTYLRSGFIRHSIPFPCGTQEGFYSTTLAKYQDEGWLTEGWRVGGLQNSVSLRLR